MDQALLDGGYRCYTGENIDVYFNTAICQHSGNCVRGNGKLFNLKRKPWIMPDEVDVTTVVKVIDTCPSGRQRMAAFARIAFVQRFRMNSKQNLSPENHHVLVK